MTASDGDAKRKPSLTRERVIAACDGSKTSVQIADDIGCTIEYVQECARRYGLRLARKKGPNNQCGPWTDEKIALLEKLFTERLSRAQMAARLGPGFTRNSVIGKIARLGLTAITAKTAPKFSQKRLKTPKPRSQSPWKSQWTSAPAEPLPMPIPRIDDLARKPLRDLDDHECRWPVGDPREAGFGFCALERIPGLPYCGGHAARAYTRSIPANRNTPEPAKAPETVGAE